MTTAEAVYVRAPLSHELRVEAAITNHSQTKIRLEEMARYAEQMEAELGRGAGGEVSEPLVLDRKYKTIGGEEVTLVTVHNAGKDHETMACIKGRHWYSRSPSRIIGRSTGAPIDYPNNIVLRTRPPVAGLAVPEESDQEADFHYCDVAESFVRKMRMLGPITEPEAIAVEAVITRLRRYANNQAAVPVGLPGGMIKLGYLNINKRGLGLFVKDIETAEQNKAKLELCFSQDAPHVVFECFGKPIEAAREFLGKVDG